MAVKFNILLLPATLLQLHPLNTGVHYPGTSNNLTHLAFRCSIHCKAFSLGFQTDSLKNPGVACIKAVNVSINYQPQPTVSFFQVKSVEIMVNQFALSIEQRITPEMALFGKVAVQGFISRKPNIAFLIFKEGALYIVALQPLRFIRLGLEDA